MACATGTQPFAGIIMTKSEHLRAAIDAARAGEQVIRRYYRKNIEIQVKEDQTPVTAADIEAEEAIKQVIAARFPDHGFFGEETGIDNPDAEYVWLIDPIDGTKSFVRRYPFFSTQIALMHRGRILVGVSNAPEFAEMAWAEAGQGAWLNGEAIAVSDITDLGEAMLSLGNIATLAAGERWGALGDLVRRFNRVRGYGDFYHYHLLASGRLEAVIESDVNVLDVAALSCIVTEAGGAFTDLGGDPVGLETTSVLAANGPRLYERMREILEEERR
jgi:histidinol-phosphatase